MILIATHIPEKGHGHGSPKAMPAVPAIQTFLPWANLGHGNEKKNTYRLYFESQV